MTYFKERFFGHLLQIFSTQFLALTLALLSGCSAGNGLSSSSSTGDTEDSPAVQTCPENYILVPASTFFNSAAFCAAKFEMKAETNDGVDVFNSFTARLDPTLHKPESRPDGLPWVRITLNEAVNECASLSGSHSLMTAQQWAIIARNIESVAGNWSNNVARDGRLYTNHSDGAISPSAIADGHAVTSSQLLSAGTGADEYLGTGNASSDAWGSGKEQKRTLQLTTGEYIWDLSGNARERVRVDANNSSINFTGPAFSNHYEISSSEISTAVGTFVLSGGGSFQQSWLDPQGSGLTNAAHAIGRIYILSGARTQIFMTRGGNFASGNSPGIYSADFDADANNVSSSAGFRCVTTPN